MNQIQYERRYDELQREIQKIAEEESECLALKRKVNAGEEEEEQKLRRAMMISQHIENDWLYRNMLGNKEFVFSESNAIFKRICTERNYVKDNGLSNFKQYLGNLYSREEDYRDQLMRLNWEYEQEKEVN